jgi:hypothetical protein
MGLGLFITVEVSIPPQEHQTDHEEKCLQISNTYLS